MHRQVLFPCYFFTFPQNGSIPCSMKSFLSVRPECCDDSFPEQFEARFCTVSLKPSGDFHISSCGYSHCNTLHCKLSPVSLQLSLTAAEILFLVLLIVFYSKRQVEPQTSWTSVSSLQC